MRSLRTSGSVGGWLGNRRLYPEADRPQRQLFPMRVSVSGGGGSPRALDANGLPEKTARQWRRQGIQSS